MPSSDQDKPTPERMAHSLVRREMFPGENRTVPTGYEVWIKKTLLYRGVNSEVADRIERSALRAAVVAIKADRQS